MPKLLTSVRVRLSPSGIDATESHPINFEVEALPDNPLSNLPLYPRYGFKREYLGFLGSHRLKAVTRQIRRRFHPRLQNEAAARIIAKSHWSRHRIVLWSSFGTIRRKTSLKNAGWFPNFWRLYFRYEGDGILLALIHIPMDVLCGYSKLKVRVVICRLAPYVWKNVLPTNQTTSLHSALSSAISFPSRYG